MKKHCYKCKTIKSVDEFSKCKGNLDGLQRSCKSCQKQYYESNKDKTLQVCKEYYENNREKIVERRSRHDNLPETKQKRSIHSKEYRNKPEIKERIKLRSKEYNAKPETRQKIRENRLRYYSIPENKQKRNSNALKKRQQDIQFKLTCALRGRLCKALQYNYKAGSAVSDLGCSIAEFKIYLENQFLPGMTWENYGNGNDHWQIDHIKPLFMFDLTDREQFLQACHYTNLRPLWKIDNLSRTYEEFKEMG
jgi:hypothetical protein